MKQSKERWEAFYAREGASRAFRRRWHELLTFARNVGAGGALCAAFDDGWEQYELDQLYHAHGYRLESRWRPGHTLGPMWVPGEKRWIP